MKKPLLFLTLIALLLTGCNKQHLAIFPELDDPSLIDSELTVDQMRQDMDALVEGVIERHPDIEVKTLASTIEKSFVQLQYALQREINFTRDVSHEIRTPISVLKNVMDSNKYAKTLTEKEFEQISRAGFELEKTTSTLLTLTKPFTPHDAANRVVPPGYANYQAIGSRSRK